MNIFNGDPDSLIAKYGEELAKKIAENIAYCEEKNLDYKIAIDDDSLINFVKIFVATYAFTDIYEVSKKRKVITDHNFISHSECEKSMEMMEGLRKVRFSSNELEDEQK